MLTGFYAGTSGMVYNEQKLGMVSNNMANVDTTGFRRSMMVLRSREENKNTRWIDPQVKERLPDIYGAQRTGIYKDYQTTGDLRSTGNPLDVAIPPELENAFFAVKRLDPNDQSIYYTRNGSLAMGPSDPSNPNSEPALYVAGHLAVDAQGNPIPVDPARGELKVDTDGILYQGDAEVGRVPVYRLNKSADPTVQQDSNLQSLEQLGDSLFKVPDALADEFNPTELRIGEGGVTRVTLQGMREASNVNVFSELVEMMNATKGFTANGRAVKQHVESLSKLFQLVRG